MHARPVTAALLTAAAIGLAACPSPPPWQALEARLLVALLPDFEVQAGWQRRPAHQVLALQAVNRGYVVFGQQLVPPGQQFQAETPARHGLMLALATLAGGVLVAARARRPARAAAVAAGAAMLLLLGAGPLTLAGQVWALGVPAWSEPSTAALLAGLSQALLHGLGLALAVLFTLVARAVSR